MTCYGFKGGTGTASRVVRVEHGDSTRSWTVGVLVQSNFGSRELLMIDGVPVGRELHDWQPQLPVPPKEGSIVMVMATDAPLDFRQLGRVARRCGAGLARTGSIYGNTSGDFVIAFSTANKVPHEASGLSRTIEVINEESVTPINALFQAAAEATEEAIVNSLFKATTVIGRDGNTRHALPLELTLDIMRRYGRIT